MCSNFGHHCVNISNSIENAQSTIVRPSYRLNLQSSGIHFFKRCNALSVCSNFGHHSVDVSNCMPNAQGTIVR